jgi:O-antigen ligase
VSPRAYDNARYLELGMLALLLAHACFPAIANALASAFMGLGAQARFLVMLFLAGGAFSAAHSGAFNLGLLEVALTTQLIMLFGLVACAVQKDRVRMEAVLAISVCAGAALCGLQFWVTYFLYSLEGKPFSWISPFLDFANVRFFSQFQAYALFPAVVPLLMPDLRRFWRAFVFVAAANFWALHWMVGTRATWIGIFVSITVVPLLLRNGKLSWVRWHAAAIFTGAVIHAVFSYSVSLSADLAPVPGLDSIEQRDHGSINERIALARIAFDSVREHPLLGVGPGQFGLQRYGVNAAHPHNVPLQLLSEYGLLAGTAGIWLIVLLLAFALRTVRNRSARASDAIGATLIAALLTGLTDSLFSGNLIMPQSQVLFFVIAGWVVGRSLPQQSAIYMGAATYRATRLCLVSVGLLAVAVTTILALEYLPLARDLPAWLPRWNPHFWQYGRFFNW